MTIPSDLTLVRKIIVKPWMGGYTISVYRDSIGNFIHYRQ